MSSVVVKDRTCDLGQRTYAHRHTAVDVCVRVCCGGGVVSPAMQCKLFGTWAGRPMVVRRRAYVRHTSLSACTLQGRRACVPVHCTIYASYS